MSTWTCAEKNFVNLRMALWRMDPSENCITQRPMRSICCSSLSKISMFWKVDLEKKLKDNVLNSGEVESTVMEYTVTRSSHLVMRKLA